jgi:hypothetical protein
MHQKIQNAIYLVLLSIIFLKIGYYRLWNWFYKIVYLVEVLLRSFYLSLFPLPSLVLFGLLFLANDVSFHVIFRVHQKLSKRDWLIYLLHMWRHTKSTHGRALVSWCLHTNHFQRCL